MELINEKAKKKKGSKYKNSGELILMRFKSKEKFKFIDYVQGMLEINTMIGIDYTQSNKNPQKPISLHYVGGDSPNQYIQAMEAIIPIFSYYDHDKKFPT
jgi:copine 1/2/3